MLIPDMPKKIEKRSGKLLFMGQNEADLWTREQRAWKSLNVCEGSYN